VLTVAKLLVALDGLDHDAPVIVGIINGPRYNAADAFPEAIQCGFAAYILCNEDPRPWEGPAPTMSEDGTASLEFDPKVEPPKD